MGHLHIPPLPAQPSLSIPTVVSVVFLRVSLGTSPVVQWLRLRAPNARGLGLIPDQGIRSLMPQLRACVLQLKIPHAATKKKKKKDPTCCNEGLARGNEGPTSCN